MIPDNNQLTPASCISHRSHILVGSVIMHHSTLCFDIFWEKQRSLDQNTITIAHLVLNVRH